MHIQKIILLIAVVVGIISIFLPWFSLPIVGETKGTDLDFIWLGALIYATSLLNIFTGRQSSPLTSRQRILTAVKGGVLAGYGYLKYVEFKTDINNKGDGNFVARAISDTVTMEYGIMMFIAAGIVMVLISVVKFRK